VGLLKYKKEIPSDVNSMCELISGILTYVDDTYGKINDCVRFELKVILNELILNAIKHGNRNELSKKVKISVSILKSGYVLFLIEDEGEGYDYNCKLKKNVIVEIEEDCYDLKETGRGIHIVSNLCDKIKYNRKGNKVIALKKI
jgi:serine/threonine-protein kinase RsbW